MAIPRLRPSSPLDLNKNNAYKPPVPNIPLVAQQAIAAAHTGGSIPPMPAAKPSAPKDPFAAYGGKEHYAQSQQTRYNDAVTSGNQDLIGKLEADAGRAGYTLTKPAMPQAQPVPAPAGGAAQPVAPPMPAMPNYNDIAEAEQARYLAERQRIADQQKSGLTRAFDRSNEILGENRTLEDARLSRTLSPFSGRTSYAKGLTARERTLADEAAQGNFNAAIQGVEQGLANDRNTAAQEIMARAYQLEQDAKRYGLDYAQVFGQGPDGGPRTLEAARFDRGVFEDNRDFDRGVLESDRNYDRGILESNRDFGRQLERDARGDLVDDRNFNRSVLESDRAFILQKQQQEWNQAFEQGQFNEQKAQQAWENNFKDRSFKQEMEDAAESRGLQWANLDQRDKEFIADQAFREKQYKYQKELDAIAQQPDLQNYIGNINKLYVGVDENENPAVTNPDALRKYVISLNLPDEKTDQLLLYYGIPTN